MSKRTERRHRFAEEGRRFRKQSEDQVETFFLDNEPIKQFVRHVGWLQVIQNYVEKRRSDGFDRPLKYLTLPGPSAPDVGLLWRAGLLVRDDNGFPNVVICDDEHADDALKVLGAVRGVSKRPFDEAVSHELSPYFPFDVINLDMYGAVVTSGTHRDRALRTLAGIRRAIWQQKGQRLLLLLTTSTDDEPARKYLEDVLLQNFNEDNFKEAYLERYQALDLNPFQNDYRTFVSLVLPKAIGKMARDRGYKITEHFVAKYDRTKHAKPTSHMLCHSFELEPLGGREPKKQHEPRFRRVVWDELTEELSMRARDLANSAYAEFICTLLRRDPVDVVDILNTNPRLKTDMAKEAKSLVGWQNQVGQK
jgi:hypothetical protein